MFPPVIPEGKKDQFFSELIDEYLKVSPSSVSSEGVIYARFGRIEAEAGF